MNKFLILIAVFLLIVKVSSAQTEKGSQTLGANLGFQFQNSTTNSPSANPAGIISTNKYHSFNIGPTYSYFVSDTWALGGSLLYAYSSNKAGSTDTNQNPQDNSSKSFTGQIFLNKYVLYQNKIGFRVGPYAGYSRQTLTTAEATFPTEYDQKTNQYYAGGALDLVYYPSKNIGLALSLSRLTYTHTTSSGNFNNNPPADVTKGHTDDVTFSFINTGTSISVYYAFGGK